jgi:hypothetical protein
VTKYICEEALNNNCGFEKCPGATPHDFVEGICDDDELTCGNVYSQWNRFVPVRCVEIEIH